MTIVVTGGTGFVGTALVRHLLAVGHEVRVLSRDPAAARPRLPVRCRGFAWDPAGGTLDPAALDGADAVVHLAGQSVAEGRWTPGRKTAILRSRVDGTRTLVAAIAARPKDARPSALISASAIGLYGDRGDEVLTEDAPAGAGFLADVCVEWEREVFAAASAELRVAAIRVGVVLGRGGGALARMRPPFRLSGGGRLGNGRQWMSWIHLDDLVALFTLAVERPDVQGIVNGVAPAPVTNREFTQVLGQTLGRPTLLPVPGLALRLAFGEMASILLASQRVLPSAAERYGFAFTYPTLAGALEELCRDHATEVEYEQWIPRSPAAVFPFFSDAYNLETITPAFMRFEVRTVSTPELREGTQLDYRLRIRGVPVGWQSVIEAWNPPHGFVDRQTRGPYASWHHTHEFEPWDGGTIIRDRIRYELPLGALGCLVAGSFVARDVAAIFAFRQQRIQELFGEEERAAAE